MGGLSPILLHVSWFRGPRVIDSLRIAHYFRYPFCKGSNILSHYDMLPLHDQTSFLKLVVLKPEKKALGENKTESTASLLWKCSLRFLGEPKIRPHRRCKRACLSGGTNTVSFSWGGGAFFLQVKCMVRS